MESNVASSGTTTSPPVILQGCTEKTPPPTDRFIIPCCVKPLSLVTVTDGAMRPALEPGQQVFVQHFHPHGVGYMEQRFALRYKGRVIIRRTQIIQGGYRVWGNQDGYEMRLTPPDGWERPDDWRQTGVLHPDCTAIGPLVTARDPTHKWPHDTYVLTAGWSN